MRDVYSHYLIHTIKIFICSACLFVRVRVRCMCVCLREFVFLRMCLYVCELAFARKVNILSKMHFHSLYSNNLLYNII